MADRKDISGFAERWLAAFRERTVEKKAFGEDFGRECGELGFLSDLGAAFTEQTGCALYDSEKLSEVYDSIRSVDLVGSALHSSWRAFTHWMVTSLDEARVRVWFIALLEKLSELTGGKKKGDAITLIPSKIQLISFRKLRLADGLDDEVEQHITINDRGMAYVSVFSRDENFEKEPVSKKNTGIGKAKAMELLESFASVFSFREVDDTVSFDASWALVLTDVWGGKHKYASSMVPYGTVRELTPLSEDVRTVLGDPSLMVLDGECGKDSIESIDVEYLTEDGREALSLVREFGTLVYEKESGSEYRTRREWRVGDEVSYILDELYGEKVFRDRPGRPSDFVEKSYRIDISYRKRGLVTLRGVYDADGLPKSYPVFASKIADFLDTYAPEEELLDPALYSKRKRSEGEFMVCSVQFRKEGPLYYYLSTDDDLVVGDLVEVQLNDTELTNTGIIKRIELHTREESPVDVEKAQWIVRKAVIR